MKKMHRNVQNLIFLIFSLIAVQTFGQDTVFYISPKADSLSNYLIEHPANRKAQVELMNEYIDRAHPELGLLEILDLESSKKLKTANLLQKAKILFWLEREKDAFKTFVRAYLHNPDGEIIKYLVISDYAQGNKQRSVSQLKRFIGKNDNLPMEIANLYQELFVNKRYAAAEAARNLLFDFDKSIHDKLFPLPKIYMLGSEDELYSTSDKITLSFEIKHRAQIKSISVAGNSIYQFDESANIDPATPFDKSFSKTLPIHSGNNIINIEATDVYGYKAVRTVEVKGLKFEKNVVYNSAAFDTLTKRMKIIESYIPKDSIVAEKPRGNKCVMFSSGGGESGKSALEFWYGLFTDGRTGKFLPANIKFLDGKNATASNFRLVFDKWLLQDQTLQTKALLYFSGNWQPENGRFYLATAEGKIDPAIFIRTYTKRISSGLMVMLDGISEVDSSEFNYIGNLVNSVNIPVDVVVFDSKNILPRLTDDFSIPDSLNDSLFTAQVELDSLSEIFPEILFISNGKGKEIFAENPAVKVKRMHTAYYSLLENRLKKAKLSKTKRETVLKFCNDWRRYGEMQRFYSGIITAEELFIQADEYFTRISGVENEN